MAKAQGSGVVLGYLRYVLGLDSLAFQEGLGDADKRLKAAQKSLQKTADKFKTVGAALTEGVSGPLIAMAAKAVQGARDQAAAVAQVDAAIKSMGNTAGLSSEQLSKFADKLELNSLVDADEILKTSTANLLTFGNVAGENFLKAQQAAVDLAERMGGDLQGATLMIGKALNDPVKGLTALSRAGIQFTDSQKAQIKAMQEVGNVAGAQAIMLGELNRQFGGAAEAAAKADPMRQVFVKLGQVGDTVGEKLLPIIPVLADALISVLDAFTSLSPETQKWVLIVGAAATALGPLALGVAGLVSGFAALLPVLAPIGAAIGTLATIITTGAIPAIGSLIVALSPILVPLAAVAAAITGVYLVWKNWDKIEPILRNLYTGVKLWLIDKLGAVWNYLSDKLKAVGKWFYDLYDAVVGHSYIPDMVDEIGQNMDRLDHLMVDQAQKATKSTADNFRDMAARIGGIIDSLYPKTAELRAEMEKLAALQADTTLSEPVRMDAIARQTTRVRDAQTAASEEVSPALKMTPQGLAEVERAWASVESTAAAAASSLQASTEATGNAFVDMANKSLNALSNLANAIKNGGVLDILSSAFNAFGSIAGSGLFGKNLKASFSNFTPISGFRANGGPVSAGKTYIVGERGPEMFTASRSGYIHPNAGNDNGGRGGIATIVPSQYFDVVVDNRAAHVAAPMVVAGSQAASAGAQKAIARRGGRRLA